MLLTQLDTNLQEADQVMLSNRYALKSDLNEIVNHLAIHGFLWDCLAAQGPRQIPCR